MKEQFTQDLLDHMTRSIHQLSNILALKKESCAHLSRQICAAPETALYLQNSPLAMDKIRQLNGSVVSYLNSLSELADVMAEQLEIIIDQLTEQEEE